MFHKKDGKRQLFFFHIAMTSNATLLQMEESVWKHSTLEFQRCLEFDESWHGDLLATTLMGQLLEPQPRIVGMWYRDTTLDKLCIVEGVDVP